VAEWTPDTDEVREEYIAYGSAPDRGEAFDRWLAGVKAEAWDEGCNAGRDYEYVVSRGNGPEPVSPHRTSANAHPEKEPK
jgi:hypothetical protein